MDPRLPTSLANMGLGNDQVEQPAKPAAKPIESSDTKINASAVNAASGMAIESPSVEANKSVANVLAAPVGNIESSIDTSLSVVNAIESSSAGSSSAMIISPAAGVNTSTVATIESESAKVSNQ